VREGAKYAGGLLLTILLLLWVFRGVDAPTVLRQIGSASLLCVVGCAALNFGHCAFRVWRWQALLAPTRPHVAFRSAFVAVVLGYLTTWVVPGRLGELVRPLLLSTRDDVPLGPCLGTVVVDRLLDGATIAALFAVGSFFTPLAGPAAEHASLLRTGSLALVGVAAGGLAAMVTVTWLARRGGSWLRGWPGVVRWLGRTATEISLGATALRRPRLAARVAVHSLAAWLAIAGGTWLGVRAVGIDLAFGAVLVILPMLALGVAVPTPGGAGGYHGAMKLGLLAFGVGEAAAVGAALVVHAVITVPILLVGVALLWTENISWREIRASADAMRRLGTHVATSGAVGTAP
jgi:uncharacterized membrane protein YbhN (UPF0104 family)